MKNKIQVSISVFEENFKMAKKAYSLNSSMEACACASAFIGDTIPCDAERFQLAKGVVKSETRIFSTLRGNAKQVLAATLCGTKDPTDAMRKIDRIYKLLDKKFFDSDYLVISAILIYKSAEPSEYESVVNRTREIYKKIKKDHRFITGSEDVTNCVLMALTGIDSTSISIRCEEDFQALRKYYRMKNKIQYLACMLSVFDGNPGDLAEKTKKTDMELRDNGIRFESQSMPVVAAMAALVEPADLAVVCGTIREVSDQLKKIRGMGSLGSGKNIRNMIATAIVMDAYTSESRAKISCSISAAIITAIIAAETAAICAAVAASSAAAASN